MPFYFFIFGLPKAFGTINHNYFKPGTLAKLAVFFETYYLVTRQYGICFSKSSFPFIAYETSYLAKHVAIKNKIQHLARIKVLTRPDIEDFLENLKYAYSANILDAALI